MPKPAVFKLLNNCAVLLLPGKMPTFGNKVIHELCGQSQQTLGMNEAQTAQNLRQLFEAASAALEEKYEWSINILKEECRAKLYSQHLLGITHSDARWRVITYEHQTGCEKKTSLSHKETELLHWTDCLLHLIIKLKKKKKNGMVKKVSLNWFHHKIVRAVYSNSPSDMAAHWRHESCCPSMTYLPLGQPVAWSNLYTTNKTGNNVKFNCLKKTKTPN